METNGYHKRLRQFFAGQGLACCVWDKAGCGKSEGNFNDGPVQESAKEAIAAIGELKRRKTPGSERIGLWGLSRGGYVCPLIISSYPSIAFWISVSGPDGEETFGYLLERNFLIEGRSTEQTKQLMKAWSANVDIARHGGTWAENQKAMEVLRADPFYQSLTKGDSKPTEEGYLKWQRSFLDRTNPYPVNEKTGLQIYVKDFDRVLSKIDCPVLALFGEKDSQVDWQKTIAFYKVSFGNNPKAKLVVKTFPDANHNLFRCKTGGLREELDKIEYAEGYFETMGRWLRERGVSN
jgi:pimeloyl-ACP methyl ester carboxylesterase